MPSIFDTIIKRFSGAAVSSIEGVLNPRPPFRYSESRYSRTPVFYSQGALPAGWAASQSSEDPRNYVRRSSDTNPHGLYGMVGKMLSEDPRYRTTGTIVINAGPPETWGQIQDPNARRNVVHESAHAAISKESLRRIAAGQAGGQQAAYALQDLRHSPIYKGTPTPELYGEGLAYLTSREPEVAMAEPLRFVSEAMAYMTPREQEAYKGMLSLQGVASMLDEARQDRVRRDQALEQMFGR